MINKVGFSAGIYKNFPSFKSEESVEQNKMTTPDFSPNNKGLEALAAYNEAMVKKEVSDNKFNVEPLAPITTSVNADEIEGEKIYSSDGVLQSIIRRDENTYTIYTPDKENPDKFSMIEIYNKENTNFPVKLQKNYEYDNISYIDISEYSPKTGDETRSTTYKNGEIEFVSKTYETKDGKSVYVNHDYYYKKYFANISYKNNKNREVYASFDENKQLNSVTSTKSLNGVRTETIVDFYNGAPYKINSNREVVIPNTSGWELFADMKPAEYFKKIENIKEIEGEKTYYSNGALESNTFESENGKTTAHFLPDGTCDKIDSKDKEIIFDKKLETVKETLEDGKVKESLLYEDGSYTVKISDDKSYRSVHFNSNHKPSSYSEGLIEDDEQNETKWLSFNEEGMLNWSYYTS